jgi:putative transposon-encoded protein
MTNREVNIKVQTLTIKENVETVYEKTLTPFGNSGKIDVVKKYIGKENLCYSAKGMTTLPQSRRLTYLLN